MKNEAIIDSILCLLKEYQAEMTERTKKSLKYLISKSGPLNTEEMALKHRNVADGVHMYENNYPLSLGFMMNSEILDMPDKADSNPFEYQNELVSRASGITDQLYSPQDASLVDYTDMEVTRNGYGNYTFRAGKEDGTAHTTYTYKGVENSYLYGYASGTGGICDKLTIKCGEATIDSGKIIENYPLVFPMGNAQENETSTVDVGIKSDTKAGNYKLMVYAMNCDVFEKAYNELADEQLKIDRFSDTDIYGTIEAKKDGVMFLSIPYEKGWSVYVDGKKSETKKLMQAMLGVRIQPGRHEIRIKYIPEGFVSGTAISSAALLLFVLFALLDRRKKRLSPYIPEYEEESEFFPVQEFTLEDEEIKFEDAEKTSVVLYSGEESENEEP